MSCTLVRLVKGGKVIICFKMKQVKTRTLELETKANFDCSILQVDEAAAYYDMCRFFLWWKKKSGDFSQHKPQSFLNLTKQQTVHRVYHQLSCRFQTLYYRAIWLA